MMTQVLTGLLLLVLPVAYNLFFTLLARSFDYPDILRQPTDQVLERFTAGGSRLVLIWWGFAMSAVLLAPAVVLLSATLADADPTVLGLATAIGLLAALVQFLGLVRWPFAVPHLARLAGDPAICSPACGPPWPASPSSSPTCCPRCSGSSGCCWRRCSCSGRWSSSAPSRSAAGSWPALWSHSPISAGRCGCWPSASACSSPPDWVRADGAVDPFTMRAAQLTLSEAYPERVPASGWA
jgi:hypothetical protein